MSPASGFELVGLPALATPPTPAEVAAMVAAIELSWPAPAPPVAPPAERPNTWRLSGRWWGGPVGRHPAWPWRPPSAAR
jgi:hypothetical protein